MLGTQAFFHSPLRPIVLLLYLYRTVRSAAPQPALCRGGPPGRDSNPDTGGLNAETLTTRPAHLLFAFLRPLKNLVRVFLQTL